MSEPVDRRTRLARIAEFAKAQDLAKAEWEKARDAEDRAHKERLAKGERHREAMRAFQQEIVQGWQEGIEPAQLQEAGGISKPWLYSLIKKLTNARS